MVNPNRGRRPVIIPYVSAYGYGGNAGEKIAQGIADSGDIDVRSYDMVTADAAKVQEELQLCRRNAVWHAHHHCRGAASYMGFDAGNVQRDPRRKICGERSAATAERRGRTRYARSAPETVEK